LLKKGITSGPSLESYRLVSFKEISAEDREEILLSNIEGFIDENRGDRDNLFLGIPGNQVIFKRLVLPSPTEENLKEVLGFEMDRYTPFTLEDVYFDFKVVKRDKQKSMIHVLLMVVRKEVVDHYLKLFQRINIKVRGIEVISTALFNVTTTGGQNRKNGAENRWIIKGSEWLSKRSWGKKVLDPLDRFLPKGGSEETEKTEDTEKGNVARFLVNIDDNYCDVAAVVDDALLNSRSFTLAMTSGEEITDEGVKTKADQILSEVEATRLSLGDGDNGITQLTVAGSGVDQNLVAHLRERGSMDVQLLNTLDIAVHSDDAGQKIPGLSVVSGLALKGLKSVAMDVNFIPRELRPRKKINWSLICGVTLVVIILLGISSSAISFFVKERMYLAELSERVDGLKGRVKEIERMQEEIVAIENEMASLETIKTDDTSKLEILMELTEIIPEAMWLTRFSYSDSKGKREIELSGYADTASEIIPILEESELFEDVKFKSSIVKDKKTEKEKFNVTALVSVK
jgi:Tfp pilus assembly PilM family ATPase/Tfp pilus assembly protein PilN